MKTYLVITFVKCIRTTKLLSTLDKLNIKYTIFNIFEFSKSSKKFTKTLKNNLNKYHGLIISGSCKYELNNKFIGCTVNIVCDMINTINKIYKIFSNKPILGICYGMEILGILNNSKVINIPILIKKRMKIKKINKGEKYVLINKKYKIFNNIGGHSLFNHYHMKILDIKSLSKKINIIAISDYGIAGINIKDKKHYGFQFHPESSKKQGIQLIKNFLKL